MIRRRGFAEHLDLFEYLGNAVRLAVTVAAAAVELLADAVAVAVVVAAVVLLVAAPEPAAAVAVAAAVVVAVGTGVSSVPCGTVPIQDSDSKELRLPCRQI